MKGSRNCVCHKGNKDVYVGERVYFQNLSISKVGLFSNKNSRYNVSLQE